MLDPKHCSKHIWTNLNLAFSECQCNEEGSSSQICDVVTGQCPCKSDLITGVKCDESVPGHYDFPDPKRK